MLAAAIGLLYRLWFTKLCTFVDVVGPYSALKRQCQRNGLHALYKVDTILGSPQ